MSAIPGQIGNGRSGSNICPTCNQYIILKPVGDSLLSFNRDGTVHRCWPQEKTLPIGEKIQGKTILNFSLKKRRVTLTLSEDITLEISASSNDELVTMNLLMLTPEGRFEERK
jgi:hypothetical protein